MELEKVPVLVMAFCRPDFVRIAMDPIKAYKPDKIYLACDGARDEKEGEAKLVETTQRTMLDSIDWTCEVKTLFREKNLGCDFAVYEAISWFFDNEKYGIIIEDDVVLSLDFFKVCEILLPRYKEIGRIQQISGFNPTSLLGKTNTYTYGKRPMTWGWATWRRAWKSYMDMDMKVWPDYNIFKLVPYYGIFRTLYMRRIWNKAYINRKSKNTPWDTRWHFAAFSNNLISICPKVNLSKNIGNTSNGTHYNEGNKDPYANIVIGEMEFPIIHPYKIEIDREQVKADNKDFWRVRRYGLMNKISCLF